MHSKVSRHQNPRVSPIANRSKCQSSGNQKYGYSGSRRGGRPHHNINSSVTAKSSSFGNSSKTN